MELGCDAVLMNTAIAEAQQEASADVVVVIGGASLFGGEGRITGTLVGTVDRSRACELVHPGAIYLHQGRPHPVVHLDLHDGAAIVEPSEPTTPPSAQDVIVFAKGRLAGYKVPKTVEFIDAIPRSAATKVNRSALAAERER